MRKYGLYLAAVGLVSGLMMWETPGTTWAEPEGQVEASQAVETGSDDASESEDSSEEETPGEDHSASMVIEVGTTDEADGGPSFGEAETDEDAQVEDEASAQTNARQNLVNYALQFVGRPYRAGGNDPHTGADCSGFVRYVMQNGAGISMNRSSRAQAAQGRQISADQMQPGDLIFYGSGSGINHVAMYIGNGKVVHASTERTGIKTSVWNYRSPVRIISMFG